MKREIFNQLKIWKNSAVRKPLILQGARQVGKTYIVKSFAESEFKNCAYVNFDKDKRAKQIFLQDLSSEKLIKSLELRLDIKINPKTTLIFFDEIQECPDALNSLKYFCEESREYHVIAAGSLLGVKLAQTKSFPVGKVNFLELFPMSFLEFLLAIGKENYYHYLNSIKKIEMLDVSVHDDLCDLLKLYSNSG